MGHPAFFLTATEDRFCSNAHRLGGGAVGEQRDQRDQTLLTARRRRASCLPSPVQQRPTTFISFLQFLLLNCCFSMKKENFGPFFSRWKNKHMGPSPLMAKPHEYLM